MSWFKSSSQGDLEMSNTSADARAPRPSFADIEPNELRAALTPPPSPLPRFEPLPQPDDSAEAGQKTASSVLGRTLRFKGELRAEEDFVLQGRVEGSIHHTQNLTIGIDGVVSGDSRALTIVVDGTVEGDLYALESISIRQTARVVGNLLAPRVAIADGASFNGKVDMASAARAVRSISERSAPVVLDGPAVEQLLVAGEEP
jgi:cytoskeletal protein CcmA (bactofilin family)